MSDCRISGEMIGLALINAQAITHTLNLQFRSFALLEGHIQSLERVIEYLNLRSEGEQEVTEEPGVE